MKWDETLNFLVTKGTSDMYRKYGARSHMNYTSSSVATPASQSPGLRKDGGVKEFIHSLADSKLPAAGDSAPSLYECRRPAAGNLAQFVDHKSSGDGKTPPQPEPGDDSQGIIGKRPRSPPPTALDDVAATSGLTRKRQNGVSKCLNLDTDRTSPAASSPPPTRQMGGDISDIVDRGPMHVGQAGNAETGVGYPLNKTSPGQDPPGYGPLVSESAAPLANLFNGETAVSVVGASSARVGETSTDIGLDNNPVHSGYSNVTSDQAYLPSQVAHGVSVPVAAHGYDQDLQPPLARFPVCNGPAVTAAATSHGPGLVSPALSSAVPVDDTQQPSSYIDNHHEVTGYAQTPYRAFLTTNASVATGVSAVNQGTGGMPPVSHGQPEQTSVHIKNGYGAIPYAQSPDGNLISITSSDTGVPAGSRGFQQPGGIAAADVSAVVAPTANTGFQQLAAGPPVSHSHAAGLTANQGFQQPGGVPPIPSAALMLSNQSQQPLVPTGLADPSTVAHAIISGQAPGIRSDQLRLVIHSVAQHLDIFLPAMAPLGLVGPDVPASTMAISVSTGARLEGCDAPPFNAWEAAFLRAIIPPSVISLLFTTPATPHPNPPETDAGQFRSAD